MSEHHPRIRIHAQSGTLLIRDGLSISFYMRQPHPEVALQVMRSLEVYLRALGPSAFDSYTDDEGDWQPLDDAGWEETRRKLLYPRYANIHLAEAASREKRYRFDYQGRTKNDPSVHNYPDEVCSVSYWLPSELLEERGPSWVRELVLALAAPLPFSSGNAGLAFNCQTYLLGVSREVSKYCFRYPGMDVLNLSSISMSLGTRVRSPSWLTFLGQPVLGELGGAAGLRSRLHTPGTTVQELEGDRAVVTLGPWPEAGDTEQGKDLPAYRELARILEPWTFWGEGRSALRLDPDLARRWERRFLD
ncbi:DUF3396 domain-containing protein [Pyxidicoccus parkwayensis]|uniref:DUF3396 domain-containing protein n=1 Tax=Pyxidicoccus parkwayensis TaxID=2813578 RepID=A0ABX7NW14_9BACT|nr:DUF3396 domain-containing protein [Pyxidicoccus parkwaysis]QSQ23115.1 DUF3396 domain-containing protein [Pyxidicoccus parkwaysis]